MSTQKGQSGITDRDLMLLVDGELSEARVTDVQELVDRDTALRNKVAALRLSGDLLREHADRVGSRADDIADLVMGRIELEAATDVQGAEVIPIERAAGLGLGRATAREGSSEPVRASKRARERDDPSRRIFLLAAGAVAAAAAMMVWGKYEGDLSRSGPIATQSTVPESPPVIEPAPGPAEPPPSGDGEGVNGVEVAAVDFGARQGSIFYVPSSSEHTTVVVWLADEAGGE